MARHTAPLRAACAGLLLATTLAVAAEPSVDALTVAAPAKIDLDAFDASRQYAQLPNGVRMAYWDVGPRNAPVVLLIHGYTSNGRGWVQLLPYLDTSKRYLIPDLRGHGQT